MTAIESLKPLIKTYNKRQSIKVILNPRVDAVYVYIETGRNKRKSIGHKISLDATRQAAMKVWGAVMEEVNYLRSTPQAVINFTQATTTPIQEVEAEIREGTQGILDVAEEWRRTYKEPNSMGNARTLISTMRQFPQWAANPSVSGVSKSDCERFVSVRQTHLDFPAFS